MFSRKHQKRRLNQKHSPENKKLLSKILETNLKLKEEVDKEAPDWVNWRKPKLAKVSKGNKE
jgi:hypothetical protein